MVYNRGNFIEKEDFVNEWRTLFFVSNIKYNQIMVI